MIERIIEIAQSQRYLSVNRGFLVVWDTKPPREEVGRVPLDDIGAVIAHAHGLSYSNNLLVALAEKGVPFVLSSDYHQVVGVLWPTKGHHLQSKRIRAQINIKKRQQNRIWASLVKQKIAHQAGVLETIDQPSKPLSELVLKVKSGDPKNIEAQAAKRYWPALFGKSFRRIKTEEGINAYLNYGYTIYRSAIARAVAAAGLHPGIGLNHCNESNPFQLVDDLIEPFRPVIDILVWRLAQENELTSLTNEHKKVLAKSVYFDVATGNQKSPMMACIHKLVHTLVQVYLGENKDLECTWIDVKALHDSQKHLS